jgi:hypothetical protein
MIVDFFCGNLSTLPTGMQARNIDLRFKKFKIKKGGMLVTFPLYFYIMLDYITKNVI